MCCVECERKQEQNERGWVVVLISDPDEPRIRYCPDCLAEIIRSASGKDEQNN